MWSVVVTSGKDVSTIGKVIIEIVAMGNKSAKRKEEGIAKDVVKSPA
jgi:hypothetical protein